jgi:hypothetical protein
LQENVRNQSFSHLSHVQLQTLAALLRHSAHSILKKREEEFDEEKDPLSELEVLLESFLATTFCRYLGANDISLSLSDSADIILIQKAVTDAIGALTDETMVLTTNYR